MCRLAAYIGKPILLRNFLLQPEHSLEKQSWAPMEMVEARLNADGYGFAWYNEHEPACYRSIQPIWSDNNLGSIANSLERDLWLAYVRSATPGQGSGLDNTQPFQDKNLIFIHNGFIRDFAKYKHRLIESLNTVSLSSIIGNTDSEYLFALFRQILEEQSTIDQAIQLFCQQLQSLLKETATLLNFIITDGETVYAVKYSINEKPPSLYYLHTSDSFPDSFLIASEALTPSDNWHALPEQHLLKVNRAQQFNIFEIN